MQLLLITGAFLGFLWLTQVLIRNGMDDGTSG